VYGCTPVGILYHCIHTKTTILSESILSLDSDFTEDKTKQDKDTQELDIQPSLVRIYADVNKIIIANC
jgi:hypothetical protein